MRAYLLSRLGQTVLVVFLALTAETWAEIQRTVRDEVPWVFLWQQHDLYGVASWIEWNPRADEKVWMFEAKVVPR